MSSDARLFEQCAQALIEVRAAVEADDMIEASAAISDAAQSLRVWAELVRGRLVVAKPRPTKEERRAQRAKEFPEIGSKPGPKKEITNGEGDPTRAPRRRHAPSVRG